MIFPRRTPALLLRPQAAQHGVSFALREFTRRARKPPANRRTAPRQGRYWDAFREYNHALYITNLSKTEPEELVELNYQFLSTLSIQPEEFRPAALPEGWDHSPQDDPRQWLTKSTETAYYNFRANETYQQEYFRRGLSQSKGSRANIMARVLEKNPKFIREPIYAEQLDGQARKILRGYCATPVASRKQVCRTVETCRLLFLW